MRVLPGLILRFLWALALSVSAMPVRAGTVCVVDQKVVAQCARPCCPQKARVRCETVYKKAPAVVAPTEAHRAESPAGVLSEVPSFTLAVLTIAWAAPTVPADAPVFSRPRPPDRGRAPPFASRSRSSTTR